MRKDIVCYIMRTILSKFRERKKLASEINNELLRLANRIRGDVDNLDLEYQNVADVFYTKYLHFGKTRPVERKEDEN